MKQVLRAACVQFRARAEKSENIADMAPLVAEAAGRGADVVLLPEKWNAWLDGPGLRAQAEELDSGPTVEAMSDWARTHRINLIGGSIAIVGDGDRVENVSIAYDRDGTRVAAYTKIHLFDVDVGGISYRESDGTAPGSEPVVADLAGVRVGLTVCYDLRFPELYRTLALEGGATVLTVPSNFTLITGMAHWEVLLRARAIENQAFVLATGQHGYPGGLRKPSYGHSMIVDPWGTVLAQAPDGDGVIVADLDMAALADIRERLPALRHRRPDAYAPRRTAPRSRSARSRLVGRRAARPRSRARPVRTPPRPARRAASPRGACACEALSAALGVDLHRHLGAQGETLAQDDDRGAARSLEHAHVAAVPARPRGPRMVAAGHLGQVRPTREPRARPARRRCRRPGGPTRRRAPPGSARSSVRAGRPRAAGHHPVRRRYPRPRHGAR